MTERREHVKPGHEVLEHGRTLARISGRDLWIRYIGLGGDATPVEVDSYLAEKTQPTRREYNLLVDALNERLMEIGQFMRLSYAA